MKFKIFKSLFKPKYPYAPIAILGRKNVEKALGANIVKYRKLQEQENRNHNN